MLLRPNELYKSIASRLSNSKMRLFGIVDRRRFAFIYTTHSDDYRNVRNTNNSINIRAICKLYIIINNLKLELYFYEQINIIKLCINSQ
jgi:hypothetical protein